MSLRKGSLQPLMLEHPYKKHSVFLGPSGSGKTELSLNYAVGLKKRTGRKLNFIDMDQTKGLFRARDFFDVLKAEGIEPVETYDFQDAPVVSPGVGSAIDDADTLCMFDVGGNHAGAVMIGQYVDKMPSGNTDYFFVINPCRPLSDTPAELERSIVEILYASGISPSCLKVISNPNMGRESSCGLILEKHEKLRETVDGLGLQIVGLAVDEALAGEFGAWNQTPIIPLHMYMRSMY